MNAKPQLRTLLLEQVGTMEREIRTYGRRQTAVNHRAVDTERATREWMEHAFPTWKQRQWDAAIRAAGRPANRDQATARAGSGVSGFRP